MPEPEQPIEALQRAWLALTPSQQDAIMASLCAQLPARFVDVLLGAVHDHAGSAAAATFKGPLRELFLAAGDV